MTDDGISIPPKPSWSEQVYSSLFKLHENVAQTLFLLRDPIITDAVTGSYLAVQHARVVRELEEQESQLRLCMNSVNSIIGSIPRWYGVATGDGNDGVSRSNYHVAFFTNDPESICKTFFLHMCDEKFHDWVMENLQIDGDAEFGIGGTLYFDVEGAPAMNGGAYSIVEVFPLDPDEYMPPKGARYVDYFDEAVRMRVASAEI